jgi:ATP-dependent RNA helicase DeaD
MNSNFSESNFQELGLNEELLLAINELGYVNPTPIQANTIPYVLKGKDVLGQAQTGTGKTAAFALPLINNIDLNDLSKRPQIMVLTPTRELAIQVTECFEQFSKHVAKMSSVSIYGGQEYGRQIQALRRGVHVVVGTAGRIMDHMKKGTLKIDSLRSLVLDEADEMLRMGFIDDVKWILSHTPDDCQRLLFSATMPRDVISIVNASLRDPHKVQIKTKIITAKTIKQRFLVVKGLSKLEALNRILEVESVDGAIVFVKTKTSTIDVADGLKTKGYLVSAINGDMQQNQREHIIDQLKAGKINILVATDVVARGLDVERLSHVINFDFPQDNEAYVHRIGRTGRAGREGDAISLIYTKDLRQLRALERFICHKLEEIELPSAETVTEKRIQKFKHKLSTTIQNEDLNKFRKLANDIQEEDSTIENADIVAGLIFLAQSNKSLFVKEVPYQEVSSRGRLGTRNNLKRNSISDKKVPSKRYRDRSAVPMTTYRVEVGKADGVEPRNLVGAIANEAGIESKFIGQIKLFDKYSTVDLPADTTKLQIDHLKKVWVVGKKLLIREDS